MQNRIRPAVAALAAFFVALAAFFVASSLAVSGPAMADDQPPTKDPTAPACTIECVPLSSPQCGQDDSPDLQYWMSRALRVESDLAAADAGARVQERTIVRQARQIERLRAQIRRLRHRH